jgi:hypothetical protein
MFGTAHATLNMHCQLETQPHVAGVGRKLAFLYNLPEVESAHKYMGVPSVSARFSTDPLMWNGAMWLTARFMPRSLLNNRGFVKVFAAMSDPAVRVVDKIVGETMVGALHGRAVAACC